MHYGFHGDILIHIHNVLWSYSSSLPSLVPFPLIFTSFKLYFVVFFVVMGWGEGYKNGFWEREICGETNIANRSGNMYAFILNSIVIVSQVQIYGWESWGSREVNFLLYPMAVGLLLWVMCLTLFGKKKKKKPEAAGGHTASELGELWVASRWFQSLFISAMCTYLRIVLVQGTRHTTGSWSHPHYHLLTTVCLPPVCKMLVLFYGIQASKATYELIFNDSMHSHEKLRHR